MVGPWPGGLILRTLRSEIAYDHGRLSSRLNAPPRQIYPAVIVAVETRETIRLVMPDNLAVVRGMLVVGPFARSNSAARRIPRQQGPNAAG